MRSFYLLCFIFVATVFAEDTGLNPNSGEQLKTCILKSLNNYAAEKARLLIIERYNKDFEPLGMILYFKLIQNDVRTGVNGFTGKSMSASPIYIFKSEIVAFSQCIEMKNLLMK